MEIEYLANLNNGSQNVVPGVAASVSSGNVLEIQILWPS